MGKARKGHCSSESTYYKFDCPCGYSFKNNSERFMNRIAKIHKNRCQLVKDSKDKRGTIFNHVMNERTNYVNGSANSKSKSLSI